MQVRRALLPDTDVSLDASRVVVLRQKKSTRTAAPVSSMGDASEEHISLPADSQISGSSNKDEPGIQPLGTRVSATQLVIQQETTRKDEGNRLQKQNLSYSNVVDLKCANIDVHE